VPATSRSWLWLQQRIFPRLGRNRPSWSIHNPHTQALLLLAIVEWHCISRTTYQHSLSRGHRLISWPWCQRVSGGMPCHRATTVARCSVRGRIVRFEHRRRRCGSNRRKLRLQVPAPIAGKPVQFSWWMPLRGNVAVRMSTGTRESRSSS